MSPAHMPQSFNCRKMRLAEIFSLSLSLALVFGGVVGLKWRHHSTRERKPSASQTLCPSYPYPVANASTMRTMLDPFLRDFAKNASEALKGSPGGAVVSIVYNDTLLWTQGFGLINMSDPGRGPPTANTGFRIGSITKLFTALMMLMLRDSGKLESLDDNVTRYLPEFSIQNPFKTHRGITFRQLSSHMSGLPRNPPCPGLFDTGCNLSYPQLYDNLSKLRLMFPPGTQPAYSNLGFGLLGRVLEKIQGPTWEEQVAETVIKPLAMNNSGNSFTPETVKNIAVGYYPDGTKAELINIGWDAPAGQMYSSTHDLAQFMKLLFRPEDAYNLSEGQILDGESIREWMQPAYKYADRTGFGHPWELKPVGNYTLRTKDGAINGYNAEFQFAHEIKTGFVFLHSCDSCTSHETVTKLAQGLFQQASAALQVVQPGPALPPSPTDYTGTYVTNENTVTVELGTMFGYKALILTYSSVKVILDWREEDEFQLSLHGGSVACYYLGGGQIGEWIYFSRAGSRTGRVTSATIPGLAYGVVYKRQ